MLRRTILLASFLSVSQAWINFPGAKSLQQDPWHEATPRNLETQPTQTATPSEPSPAVPSISTIPSMTTVPVPTVTDDSLPFHEQLFRWIKRQGGAPANPGAAQPTGFSQVSPATVLTMMSKGQNIQIPYTQTFPVVADQWPSPSVGTIGLGTIQGEIGKVRTKRSEPEDALVTIQTTVPEADLSYMQANELENEDEMANGSGKALRRRQSRR